MAGGVSLLDQEEVFFPHLHLTGALWDEEPRDSFESRVSALAAHGCTGMGMGREELAALIAARTLDGVRGVLADHGVRIDEIELLFGWDAGPDLRELALSMEAELMALAEGVGAARFKASAFYPPGAELPPVEELGARFGALCDRAAARGLSVELESIAVNPGFDYSVAADVVAAADRPNGGLLIDVWHLFRDPHGMEALAKVDGGHVIGLELCDATAEPVGALGEECVERRLLPGEGELDLAGLIGTLEAKGVDVPLAVEVLSTELRALPPEENVARTLAAVRAFRDKLRTA